MKNTFYCIQIILLATVFLLPINSIADESLEYKFIQSLYEEKDYYRCITESKRFLFYYPEHENAQHVKTLIAKSNYKGGNKAKAVEQLLQISQDPSNQSAQDQSIFFLGKVYFDEALYKEAETQFLRIIKNVDSEEGLNIKAQKYIDLINIIGVTGTEELQDKAENESDPLISNYMLEYSDLKFKSPKTAGTLSTILPGAGQYYVGRKRDAVAAFLLNGLFIWGLVESIEDENYGTATVLGVFELGWYGGNIYSAVNAAHKHNQHLRNRFIKKFKIDSRLDLSKKNEKSFLVNLSYNY